MSSGYDDYALPFVWRANNDGQGYHVTPGDPGAGTNRGVIEATWAAAQHLRYVPANVTLEAASLDQLSTVLRMLFWNAVKGSQINRGVDVVMFNIAMASGPGTAVKLVQRAMGFAPVDTDPNDPRVIADKIVDGDFGSVTLRSINGFGDKNLINLLTDADETFYAELATFRLFGKGWDRRAEDCRTLALSLLVGP